MASIQNRGSNQYRVQIRRNGVAISKTFDTRKEAEDWGRVMEGRVTGGEVIEKKTVTTLAQACEWMKDQVPETPNANNVKGHLRYWSTSKLANWSLATIHEWDLVEWRREVLDEEGDGEPDISPQTVIHRLNALSKLFQTWGRAHRVALLNPVQPGVRPGKPEGRSRRILMEEEEKLLKAADKTKRPWLRHCIIIALETAMRQSEQHSLPWERVNLEGAYVDILRTKNDRPRRVPLSDRAIEAFKALRKYPRPVPVETPSGLIQAFGDARIGFPDLRWHDLRHEAVSRLFELTDLRDHEIMAISGHLTSAMLSRYTHLRADKLADRLPGGKLNPAAQSVPPSSGAPAS